MFEAVFERFGFKDALLDALELFSRENRTFCELPGRLASAMTRTGGALAMV